MSELCKFVLKRNLYNLVDQYDWVDPWSIQYEERKIINYSRYRIKFI